MFNTRNYYQDKMGYYTLEAIAEVHEYIAWNKRSCSNATKLKRLLEESASSVVEEYDFETESRANDILKRMQRLSK